MEQFLFYISGATLIIVGPAVGSFGLFVVGAILILIGLKIDNQI
jgi:hypothetical protein